MTPMSWVGQGLPTSAISAGTILARGGPRFLLARFLQGIRTLHVARLLQGTDLAGGEWHDSCKRVRKNHVNGWVVRRRRTFHTGFTYLCPPAHPHLTHTRTPAIVSTVVKLNRQNRQPCPHCGEDVPVQQGRGRPYVICGASTCRRAYKTEWKRKNKKETRGD